MKDGKFLLSASRGIYDKYTRLDKWNGKINNITRWLISYIISLFMVLIFLIGSLFLDFEGIAFGIFWIMLVLPILFKGLVFQKVKKIKCPICNEIMFCEHDMLEHLEYHAYKKGYPIEIKIEISPPIKKLLFWKRKPIRFY